MRTAHVIIINPKGEKNLIGPGPVAQIRLEAGQLKLSEKDDATLYVDGRAPRKLGRLDVDKYLETVNKENVAMIEREKSARKASATKTK